MKFTAEQITAIKKLKIGILVRNTLPEILKKGLITESEIKLLQKADYSKITFDVNYPILKKIDKKRSIAENRYENSYSRYYAEPVKSDDCNYLITSEWYEKSQEDYIRWLQRKVKDEV